LRARFAWGDDEFPVVRVMANPWHGEFPVENLGGDQRTSPVNTSRRNGYGLYDMTRNVWDWKCDRFDAVKPESRLGQPLVRARRPSGLGQRAPRLRPVLERTYSACSRGGAAAWRAVELVGSLLEEDPAW
jgi:formylglycine-generating enzyme required for sulfatase activity